MLKNYFIQINAPIIFIFLFSSFRIRFIFLFLNFKIFVHQFLVSLFANYKFFRNPHKWSERYLFGKRRGFILLIFNYKKGDCKIAVSDVVKLMNLF